MFNEELGASLKVGDLVAIGEPSYGEGTIPARVRWVEPITETTKLHVTTAGQKWNRKTGYRWGEKPLRWSTSPRIRIVGVMTPGEADEWREQTALTQAETKERAALLNLFEELFYQRQKSPVWSCPIEKVRQAKKVLLELR